MEDRDRKSELFAELAVVGKAFASAKRLEIIDLLAQGERTVEGLARAAGLGVSTASAHLQILKLANLVRTRRDGTRVFYTLADDDVATLYASMRTVAREHSAQVDRALAAYLGTGDDDISTVGREELLGLLDAGTVELLDVRPAEEFAAGHIPGAVSVPLGDLTTRAATLPPSREVVAYCRGAYCVLAHDAVRLLTSRGIPARRLEDGMLEWRLAGHPVEAGHA